MAAVYDEIEIEDMTWCAETASYSYPCPCGDKFAISLEELLSGEDIARCPSCSLRIRVIADIDALEKAHASSSAASDAKTTAVEAH